VGEARPDDPADQEAATMTLTTPVPSKDAAGAEMVWHAFEREMHAHRDSHEDEANGPFRCCDRIQRRADQAYAEWQAAEAEGGRR
jgi:hypothetical protein